MIDYNAVVPSYVEEMFQALPVYNIPTSEPQEQAATIVNDIIHFYYYHVANFLIKKYQVGYTYIPFYKMNEMVANYMMHIFQRNHPDLPYHNAVWQACISRQYHTTVYCWIMK